MLLRFAPVCRLCAVRFRFLGGGRALYVARLQVRSFRLSGKNLQPSTMRLVSLDTYSPVRQWSTGLLAVASGTHNISLTITILVGTS